MTVTITLTDPTADESRAVRAYLDSLHGAPDFDIEVRPASTFHLEPSEQTRPVPEPGNEGWTQRTVTVTVPSKADDSQVTTAEDAGAPDFDSAGMPWDERIHASSRATVADGTWRKKRGVSPEEVAAVEAELARDGIKGMDAANEVVSSAMGTTDAQTVGVPEVASYKELPDDATGEQVAEAFAGLTAPEAPAQDAPPPPPAATPNPFLAVMSRIGKSKLDKAKKDELLTAAGALDDKGNPSILVLNKRPELIDGFVALLDSEGV